MVLKNKLQNVLKTPWSMAFIFLGIFYLVTGYKYGWDDQQLEIPLLKSLIDPTLYQGDYYVESLKKNFFSFFYPVLAKVISVEQIPQAYFFLYLVSRYFLFFWIYKLWLLFSQDRLSAFTCVVTFILMARVQEFLYRTFSHQEFALAMIFAAIYFFFESRFLLASIILGFSANIHALYSLFPMFFIGCYLLFYVRKHGFGTLIKCCLGFLTFCLPFILWIIDKKIIHPPPVMGGPFYKYWVDLYLLACPQNFFFPDFPFVPASKLFTDIRLFYHGFEPYIFLALLFILNLNFNSRFRSNKKATAACWAAAFLLLVSFIFTYCFQNKLINDLNLVRNSQFLTFFLMGFAVILIIEEIKQKPPVIGFILGILFAFLKFTDNIANCAMLAIILVLTIQRLSERQNSLLKSFLIAICLTAMAGCLYGIAFSFFNIQFKFTSLIGLTVIFLCLSINYFLCQSVFFVNNRALLKKLFIVIPICIYFFQYVYYSQERRNAEGPQATGFWRLQRSWEDMQRYAKENTEQGAVFLVPYNMEMGGFRIHSDRKVVVCYRDCGIIGFDYNAAVEWRKRINDVEAFKYNVTSSLGMSIQNAVMKYHADYIVFLRYAAPNRDTSFMEKVYTNIDFTLFKIKGKP